MHRPGGRGRPGDRRSAWPPSSAIPCRPHAVARLRSPSRPAAAARPAPPETTAPRALRRARGPSERRPRSSQRGPRDATAPRTRRSRAVVQANRERACRLPHASTGTGPSTTGTGGTGSSGLGASGSSSITGASGSASRPPERLLGLTDESRFLLLALRPHEVAKQVFDVPRGTGREVAGSVTKSWKMDAPDTVARRRVRVRGKAGTYRQDRAAAPNTGLGRGPFVPKQRDVLGGNREG